MGDPAAAAAAAVTVALAVGLAIFDGAPGLTIVGGIAGLTKRSDVRLLDGATMCPC